ncbi:hypothetical protein SESBI_00405 [Sesbania bispinosa]|nr:hypothetical protein SESBI_00405 [Sesbania bispinosa]
MTNKRKEKRNTLSGTKLYAVRKERKKHKLSECVRRQVFALKWKDHFASEKGHTALAWKRKNETSCRGAWETATQRSKQKKQKAYFYQ